jgi:hypothetical protein
MTGLGPTSLLKTSAFTCLNQSSSLLQLMQLAISLSLQINSYGRRSLHSIQVTLDALSYPAL